MRLFDTTFLIDLLNEDPAVTTKVKQIDQERTLNGLSVISAHEYLFGIYRYYKTKLERGLKQAYQDLSHFHIFPLDYETVKISSQIHARLMTQGTLIGLNDIYIAATAIQHHLTLTTKDRHFLKIVNLKTDFY